VLELLGTATWRLPRWLDDLLPNVNIEGSAARADALEALASDRQLEQLDRVG